MNHVTAIRGGRLCASSLFQEGNGALRRGMVPSPILPPSCGVDGWESEMTPRSPPNEGCGFPKSHGWGGAGWAGLSLGGGEGWYHTFITY